MPAAQTLLLFAHAIDTNITCSRMICDDWLCFDFPSPETGMALLSKALDIRTMWNNLLSEKLKVLENKSVENEIKKQEGNLLDRLEYELELNLIGYMNTDISYTIKRLLPADLKVKQARQIILMVFLIIKLNILDNVLGSRRVRSNFEYGSSQSI